MTHKDAGLARESSERRGGGRFDKAFPVFLSGPTGVGAGIGRNISDGGMFVEVREPYPLGTQVSITFSAPGIGTEVTLLAEVRYQCFINYGSVEGTSRSGLRGIGVRFVGFDDKAPGSNGEPQ